MGKQLLELLMEISERQEELNNVFGLNEFLHKSIDKMFDIIGDHYGIELMGFKEGDEALNVMTKCSEGKITISKADKLLKKIAKNQ